MVPLRIRNFYLKNIYESPNSMDTISIFFIEDNVMSFEEIYFGVKQIKNGKAKDIKVYEASF